MKNFLCWLATALGLYVLQTALLPMVAWHGTSADLLLLLTISFAFLKGMRQGAFMGFMLGLLEDLGSGGFFGVNAFCNLLLGYVCGFLSNRVLKDSFFLPVAASVAGTIAVFCLMEILMFLLGYGLHPLAHFQYKLFPMLFFNVIFAWPVHTLVRRVISFLTVKK